MNSISINDIREQFEEAYTSGQLSRLQILMLHYRSDERPGVYALIDKYEKRLAGDAKEEKRLEKITQYEDQYETITGARYICGIDEVGRGPLAGPVVAGAVILPVGLKIPGVDDSKKLSAKKREQLYDVIMEKALATGIGMAGPDRIDEINILQATYEAMRQAIANLKDADGNTVVPDLLLNDAVTIPGIEIPQVPIIHGDAASISIGAASIIAKVTRDRMMVEYDSIFPGYGFASNKGYGAAAHIAALKELGPTVIHRKSFITKFV